MLKLKRLAVAAVTVLLALAVLPASAQQNDAGSGLSISPTVSEFTIKPGAADKIDVTLKNITVSPITAQASIADFTADNETGSPKIITDPNTRSPNSIKGFVVGLEDVPLAVGEQKKISVPLQIPSGTTPGAYFGIIRYKAVPSNMSAPEEGQVALSASVGTIVLITVPGTVTEQVQIASLRAYSGDSEGKFFTKTPTQLGVEVRNLGNGFVKPFGTVEIRDMSGNEVYTYQVNTAQPRSNVLPDSSRVFKNDIKNVGKIGRYTATASITYGAGSEVLIAKTTFWYVPLWLAIVTAAILVLLILGAWRAFRRYRRGTRHHRRHKR